MGDILHALPAATALRAACPDLFLAWAVEPQWQALFRADSSADPAHAPSESLSPAQPLVNHLHLIPAKRWGRSPLSASTLRSILSVRAELRSAHYSTAIDLQGAIRSAIFARWAHAPTLIGEAAPREPAARFFFHQRVPSQGVHVIEQARDVLQAFQQAPLLLPLPTLPVDPTAAAWCTSQGVHPSPSQQAPHILLHPGAGWGAKRWPIDRYIALGTILSSHLSCSLVIHAAPREAHLADALAQGLHRNGLQPLVLTPSISQLIELSRRVTLAIGGDTGPLHLAAALGKPTVGIFGPTDPARNGPFHQPYRVLRDPLSKRDHSRLADPESGLLRIQPESVAQAALALLAPSVCLPRPPNHPPLSKATAP